MKLDGCCVVVTGGANGIGAALCRRFAAECARGVVGADIDEAGARAVADDKVISKQIFNDRNVTQGFGEAHAKFVVGASV